MVTGLDPWDVSMAGTDVDVTQCDDGSFCCGAATNGSSCCAEGRGVFMVDGKESRVNPNKTSTTPTTPSATAAHSTPSTTASHHADAEVIAGGVVGGVAALSLLIGLLYWFVRRRRRNSAASPSTKMGEWSPEPTIHQERNLVAELPPDDRPIEADSYPRVEMDGGARQEWKLEHATPEYRGPGYF